MGLAFKQDIDDLRESKAALVAETLLDEGFKIFAVEPNINSHMKLPLLNFSNAIEQSDIVCILVPHREFLHLQARDQLNKCGAIDFCGILS